MGSFKTLITKFPAFFQRNSRTLMEMHRKIKTSVTQGIFMENREKFNHAPNESFNYIEHWYGKMEKLLNCKTLYNMYTEKRVVQAEISDKTRKYWELLYTSDL
jgi:hypothetical protein